MKARILKDNPIHGYKKGEIGTLLENDYDKYDYLIKLKPTIAKEDYPPFIEKGQRIDRTFYFYKEDVEIL